MTSPAKQKPFLLLAILTLVWGVNWPVMKIGATELPPFWFRGLGLVLGTALLGLYAAMKGVSLALPRGRLTRVCLLSLPNIMVWYLLVVAAITMLPSGRAAILGFTMPVWAALIGVFVYGERLHLRTAIGVACAVGGVALLVTEDWSALLGHPLGVVLMLVAAASWAWGTHAMRRADLGMDTLALTFWMMLVACPVLIGVSAAFEWARWRMPMGHEWWPVAYNAVLVLALCNVLWFSLARTLSPVASGLSSMLIPVVGVFSGMVILGETPHWRDIAALILICAAVATVLVRRSNHAIAKNKDNSGLQSVISTEYARHRNKENP